MYDDIIHVPLFMRWPGKIGPGTVCDAFVSHEIDLARTFLEVAGIDPPESFVGRNLVAEAAGELASPREDMLCQYMGTSAALYSLRSLSTRKWKYVYHPAAFDELYDMENDRGELVNRIDDPECAEIVQRMRRRMGEWMQQVGDKTSPPLYVWDGPGR
jgi:arylsulfatase A-like enzyme